MSAHADALAEALPESYEHFGESAVYRPAPAAGIAEGAVTVKPSGTSLLDGREDASCWVRASELEALGGAPPTGAGYEGTATLTWRGRAWHITEASVSQSGLEYRLTLKAAQGDTETGS